MTDWYFADAARQRHGPVSAEALIERYRQGLLPLDSLVWREGLDDWRPLRDFSGELSMDPNAAETFHTSMDAGKVTTPDSPDLPPSTMLSSQHAMHTGNEVVYAGFLKRFAAATIDTLILTIMLLPLWGITAVFIGGFDVFVQGLASGQPPQAFWWSFVVGLYILPIVVQAVYFTWMQAAPRQSTLGKKAVGIKVTRTDGSSMVVGRSFGRWAALFFSYLFTCGIAYIVSAFMVGLTERKQGLHDLVVDTLVVDRWAYTDSPELQRRELGAVTIAMLVLIGVLLLGYCLLIVFAIGMGLQR